MQTPSFIPLSVPNFSGKELAYVTKAVQDGWVSTGGAEITAFEKQLAAYLHLPAAAAVQSGTAGLHLAMLQAGIKPGDEVLVPTLTFIAAVNPVKYCGAEPVFMDCDDSLCLDIDKTRQFCENECNFIQGSLVNKKSGRPVKAVVAVHIFGNMVKMAPLIEIAEKYNLKIIEDATEALGSYEKSTGRFAGTIGDFGVYSFNGNKIITTGGGGMVVAKSSENLQHMKHLSTQAKDDTTYFIHSEIGYNYRMTNLQAALGLAQLEQLEKFIVAKNNNYQQYINQGIQLLPFQDSIRSNKWFYSYECPNSDDRDQLIKYLSTHQIQSRPIWKLIHTLKPYQNCQTYNIERANYYYSRIVNIPCSTSLTNQDITRVSQTIKEFWKCKI